MNADAAIDLGREALWMALKLSLPVLLVALAAGVVVAVLQAATRIHEPTAAHVPRLLAVAVALIALMPWMMASLAEYGRQIVVEVALRLH